MKSRHAHKYTMLSGGDLQTLTSMVEKQDVRSEIVVKITQDLYSQFDVHIYSLVTCSTL